MKINLFISLILYSSLTLADIRVDDVRLKISPEWQYCEEDRQCVEISYGCSSTAANREFKDLATKQAWSVGGDPRAVSCPAPEPRMQAIRCENHLCGEFIVHQNPKILIEEKVNEQKRIIGK